MSEIEMNKVERAILEAERFRHRHIYITTDAARALFDLARRAPLPAVDRGQEGAGLLAEHK